MITIIRYRNDSYYGVEGELSHPIRRYSGFISEDRELEDAYFSELKEYEQQLEGSILLNKVHVKSALDAELSEWKEKFRRELRSWIPREGRPLPRLESLYMKCYTLFHLKGSSLEDLTRPTDLAA